MSARGDAFRAWLAARWFNVRVDLVEGLRIALFSLKANRMRTVLTTAGIGIGVATLLAILGIIQGLDTSFERQLAGMGSNTLYVSKWKWGGSPTDWWEGRNRKNLSTKHMEVIRQQSSYASAVAGFMNARTDVNFYSNQLRFVMVIGASEQYIDVSGYEMASGRFVNDVDSDNEASVVVLGADIVQTLFTGVNPLGATVLIDGRPMRVVGTLARRGKMLDLDFDKAVVIPLKTALGRFGRGRSLNIGVMVRNQAEINAAQDELVGILRRARGTPPDAADDFVINRPEQLMDMYKKLTGALYAVVAGIGFITLLVGGIGIMNIMLVSVRERTREIGVRRALGARKRTIVLQFLMEAAAVSAVGGALGTVVGLGLAQVIAAVSPLAAAVKPLTVVFGISFAAAVGLLFGIWPAARAASLDPVEALRYE